MDRTVLVGSPTGSADLRLEATLQALGTPGAEATASENLDLVPDGSVSDPVWQISKSWLWGDICSSQKKRSRGPRRFQLTPKENQL